MSNKATISLMGLALIAATTHAPAQTVTLQAGPGQETTCVLSYQNNAGELGEFGFNFTFEIDALVDPNDGCVDTAPISSGGGTNLVVTAEDDPIVADETNVTVTWAIPEASAGFTCTLSRNTASPSTLRNNNQLQNQLSLTETIPGSSTYTLNCTKGPSGSTDTATSLRLVEAQGGGTSGPLPACTPSTAPAASLTRSSHRDWEDIFVPWGQGGTGADVLFSSNNFINLEFTVPEGSPNGTQTIVSWVSVPDEANSIRVAVQDCIGAPSPARALDAGVCLTNKGPPGGAFAMNVGPGSGCRVEAGNTYVLSVAYLFSDDSKSCDQPGMQCTWDVRTF